MEPVSIIVFALPRIVREFVRNAIERDPAVLLSAELEAGDDVVAAVEEVQGRVAVVASGTLTRDEIGAVLRARPDARVLELVDDGRETYLYELRPHRIRVGEVSPDVLVRLIRTPAPTSSVPGAC